MVTHPTISPSAIVMSSSLDFERAKAYFQQCNAQGQTLYDHLAELLLRLSKQPPPASSDASDPLASFHSLSLAIKQSHVSQRHLTDLPLLTPLPPAQAKLLAAVNKHAQVVAAAYVPTAASQSFSGRLPDVLSWAPLFEAAGVSFDRDTLFTINSVLHSTAAYYGLTNLSFWGIIHGTEADYYILEHQLPATAPTQPKSVKTKAALATVPHDESPSHGVNAYQYYVSNSLIRQFTPLPHARAALLAASRDHHRLFTGRLTAAVTGHPHFDGNEADILRCQIARISHGGFAVAKGSKRVDERPEEAGGGEDVVDEEGWEGVPGEELKEAGGWVHTRAKLLKKGRVTAYVPPEVEPEGEKEDEAEKAVEDEEEEEPAEEDEEEATSALIGLDADEPPTAAVPAYLIRSSLPASHPHTVTTATPTLWPGCVNIACHSQSVSVYVGWGVKYRGPAVGGWKRQAMAAMREEWREKVGEEGEEGEEMKEQEDVLPEVEKDEEKEAADEEEPEDDEEAEEEDEDS